MFIERSSKNNITNVLFKVLKTKYASNLEITISWVQEHCGIPGNTAAFQAAGATALMSTVGNKTVLTPT